MSPSRTMSGSPEPPPSPQWMKKPQRRSVSSEGQTSTDWGYTSYNNFTRGTVSKYSSQIKESSFHQSYDELGQSYSHNNNSYSSSKTKVNRNQQA